MIDLRHENDTATLRTNGRKLNESRSVSFELGTMKNTSGSAIFTIGNTKVAAFLQGPH
jgi:exosome complex component RRP41